ncbi:MAG: SGNH/GDSL hydrolase family protein [Clostridia bacterium]|nr:SGNH/GDSL hydrolase family protein [Clostridia bacterium]
MKKTKWMSFLTVLLVVCMLCTSCFGGDEDVKGTTDDDETTVTTPEETTPGVTTTKKPTTTTAPPVTQAPTNDPEPEDMPHNEELLLGGVNITSYKIIYGRSQMEKTYNSRTGNTAWEDLMESGFEGYENLLLGDNNKADFDFETAMRLQKLILDNFGYEIPVYKDSDPLVKNETRYEILVGFTARAASTRTAANLKIDQYFCGFNSDVETEYATQYIICGGSYGATWHAIDEFERVLADPDAYIPEETPEPIDLSNVPHEDDTDYLADNNDSGFSPTAINITKEMNFTKAYDFKAVATIGDSITRGSQGVPDGNNYGDPSGFAQTIMGSATATYLEQFLSWPAVLQRELWKDYLICNYGQGNSTLRDPDQTVYPDKGPYYYNDTAKFTSLLAESDREDFEFDMVLIMLGTNDAGRDSGAASWKWTLKEEFYQEAKLLLTKISAGSPDATFVFMNAPHRCDGKTDTTAGGTERNDAAIRVIQLATAERLLAEGYDVKFYDMERYTVENLTGEGLTCAEKSEDFADKTEAEILEAEKEAHGDYYNIHTDTGTPDTTHPNWRGYGKIAEGMEAMLLHLFEGAEAPEYMVALRGQ